MGRDRRGPSNDSRRYRYRKRNGLAWIGVECRDQAIRDLSDCYGIPKEEIVAWLIESAAASEEVRVQGARRQIRNLIRHAIKNPTPEPVISRVHADGSCTQTWPDGDKFHFTPEAWAQWCDAIKNGGCASACGWEGPDNTVKIK